MKKLMLALFCMMLLQGCKSSKKMEKQPAPKKTMAAAHKNAIKKPAQKSDKKAVVKKHETNKPAEKTGARKHGMKKHVMDRPAQKAVAQKGGAKKPAQKSGNHKAKKSQKDKAVVQKIGGSVGGGL